MCGEELFQISEILKFKKKIRPLLKLVKWKKNLCKSLKKANFSFGATGRIYFLDF
jgi:hypothetical protein